MARIYDLQYHDDNVKKHPMTKEDLDFLKDLQKEMNTQDSVCQADPRYWTIAGTKKEYGYDEDSADGFEIYHDESMVAESMEKLAKYIQDNLLPFSDYDEDEDQEDEVTYNSRYKDIDIVTADDDVTLSSPEEAVEWLNEKGFEFSLSYYKNKWTTYPGTIFLTHKDALEHLKNNSHHYSDDAHPYAYTAFRSASIEKLYIILQEVDWNQLEKNI